MNKEVDRIIDILNDTRYMLISNAYGPAHTRIFHLAKTINKDIDTHVKIYSPDTFDRYTECRIDLPSNHSSYRVLYQQSREELKVKRSLMCTKCLALIVNNPNTFGLKWKRDFIHEYGVKHIEFYLNDKLYGYWYHNEKRSR
jgi:hypothetical protein